MRTAVVIKIKNKKAVVLLNGGQFLSVPSQKDWRTGDVVQLETAKKTPLFAYCCVACFLLVFLVSGCYQLYFTQTSLVSIDINPSIELGLNRFDRVIYSQGLNKEGTKILSSLKPLNQYYSTALEEILQEEEIQRYLKRNQQVVLTVFSQETQKEEQLSQQLKLLTDTIVTSCHSNAAVSCYPVDTSVVQNAHSHGVTAGKYLYLQQLSEISPDIDISQFTHHTIDQIQGQIVQCQQRHGQGSYDAEALPQPQPNEQQQPPQCQQQGCHGAHHGHGHS